MGEAKRRKELGLGLRPPSFRVRSAAVHEGAHGISDMHFGVRIPEIRVTRLGQDAIGFTDARWTELCANAVTCYHMQISQLAGPLADFQYRLHEGADNGEMEALVASCRGDFLDILGRTGATLEAAISSGKAYFLVFMGRESQVSFPNEMSAAFVKNLVSDTAKMIAAYCKQIAELANAILVAPDMKLTEAAVTEWRDRYFQMLDVALSNAGSGSGVRRKD